jgi:hypothetical protein
LALVVRLNGNAGRDRTRADIALCLIAGTSITERQHELVAASTEISRRAGLWAADFLRDSLGSNARRTG